MRATLLTVAWLGMAAGQALGQTNLAPLPPVTPTVTPPAPNVAPIAPPVTALTSVADGAKFPIEMTIVAANGVDVRGGPALQYNATSKLRFGERVVVVRESKAQPGWYEIRPPAGSFSWVNSKYVRTADQRIGVLEAEGNAPVPILPGSTLINGKPNSEVMKASSGSLVPLLARPMEADGEKWYPIAPMPTEVRFIPKEAVLPPQSTSVAPPNWTRPPETNVPSGGWGAPGQFVGANSGGTVGTPASFSQQNPGWTPHNGVTAQPPQWSQWGKLRRTEFTDNTGQPMYVLEDRAGRPIVYATSGPGTSLRSYIGQTVCLYGMVSYRSDGYQRTHYILATHVATP